MVYHRQVGAISESLEFKKKGNLVKLTLNGLDHNQILENC